MVCKGHRLQCKLSILTDHEFPTTCIQSEVQSTVDGGKFIVCIGHRLQCKLSILTNHEIPTTGYLSESDIHVGYGGHKIKVLWCYQHALYQSSVVCFGANLPLCLPSTVHSVLDIDVVLGELSDITRFSNEDFAVSCAETSSAV